VLGTTNSCISFGWYTSATGATEEYEWNSLDNCEFYNTARVCLGGAGIQTAALAFGGSQPT
jgi:hypothetical protein